MLYQSILGYSRLIFFTNYIQDFQNQNFKRKIKLYKKLNYKIFKCIQSLYFGFAEIYVWMII